MLASRVLNDPEISHPFFVDDDMGFNLADFFFDKEFAGHICPTHHIDLPARYRVAREIGEDTLVRSVAHSYVATDRFTLARSAGGQRRFWWDDSFVRTIALEAGLTLLKRSVFEKLALNCRDLLTENAPESYSAGFQGKLLQCFAPLMIRDTGFSEDLTFCHRWVEKCGGEIWACLDEAIMPVGTVEVTGGFIDKIRYDPAPGGARFDSDSEDRASG
jgi:hypothetical protein